MTITICNKSGLKDMPNRIQVLSVKNPLLHILCKCYCFCLLLLETQLVQSVQLEKLAFFFSFRTLGSKQTNLCLCTHQNALMGTLNSFTLTSTRGIRKKILHLFSDRIAFEMMRASDLLAVTNMYTNKP